MRETASEVPEGYEPPNFQTAALQHTDVKLTWDADDDNRKRALSSKKLTGDQIREDDFKVAPRLIIIIWLLHNLVEASFDLFRALLLGDQLKPWELHTGSYSTLIVWTTKTIDCCIYGCRLAEKVMGSRDAAIREIRAPDHHPGPWR